MTPCTHNLKASVRPTRLSRRASEAWHSTGDGEGDWVEDKNERVERVKHRKKEREERIRKEKERKRQKEETRKKERGLKEQENTNRERERNK